MAKTRKMPTKKPTTKHTGKLILSITMTLIWVGASVIASQLVVGWLMMALIGPENFAKPVPTAVFSALSYCLAMVLIIFVPIGLPIKKPNTKKSGDKVIREINWQTLGLRGWPTWTDIGLAPVGYIVYILLAAGLVALFSLFPWFNASEAQDVGFSYYVSGLDRVVAFLTLVVVAPIAEEIIFRGWLYGCIRKKLSQEYSNIVTIVVSSLLVSLLFGIVHMQWNVGVNVFALSLVMCALREITGTIYAGILLHMLKNGVAFILLYVIGMG